MKAENLVLLKIRSAVKQKLVILLNDTRIILIHKIVPKSWWISPTFRYR
ncbi:hypothetical protein NTHI1209_00165 [Haemophilus influenzae]|uniref:Uncharacterized protein n=1 Tax=Haemophilus influenzae TaxID=727 RepID=A0A158SUM1_HAEIF|nr:hypothetical protein NTHI1209_00165 [Haemophilus influenzae]